MRSKTLVLIAAILALASSAMAQTTYPTRPVRIVIPYPPGGSNDVMGRLVGQKLRELLGVTTIIDNRGGGNGIIGTDAVARAAPDGQTILIASINSHLLTPLLGKTPYHPIDSFAPVGTIDSSDYVMVVSPTLPANSLQEFIALAKAKPGQLNYGSSAVNILVTTALFTERAGIKLLHVPYKGAGDLMADLMSGRVHMFMSTPGSLLSHIKSGKLKVLATTAPTRIPVLPGVPTFAESGMNNFDVRNLRGMLLPPGTPKPIVDRLSAELGKILAMPDTKQQMAAAGISPYFLTPDQFTARMKSDYAMFGQVLKRVNVEGER